MRLLRPVVALLPVLLVAGGALLLLLADALRGRRPEPAPDDLEAQHQQRNWRTLRSLFAVAVLAAAAAASVVLWFLLRRAAVADPAQIDRILQVTGGLGGDRFALLVHVTLCIGGALVLLQAGSYLRALEIDRPEFPVLVLLSVLGGMFLASARDLLLLFVGLETLSLGTYALVAFQRASLKSTEAALKYFLLGSFAAAILLFGMALLYGLTGSLDLYAIGRALGPSDPASVHPVAYIALVFVLTGLAFKVSAVPFHMWTPDAYEGAPTPVTGFMAVVVKTAAFAVLLRVLLLAFPFGSPLTGAPAGWVSLVAGLAILTMVLGNFAALTQRNVRRLLAYSSIAHAGYALIGVVVAGAAPGEPGRETLLMRADAVGGVLYYLLGYTVATAGAFAVLAVCARRHREVAAIDDLDGLGRRHPALAFAFTLSLLSLLGLPPTAGFFGKLYLFNLAVQADLAPLAVVGVLTSVVAAYYYLRLLVAVYMREPETDDRAEAGFSWRAALGIAFASLAVIAVGLFPSRYLSVAAQSVLALFRG